MKIVLESLDIGYHDIQILHKVALSEIKRADGQTETVRSEFVVGCDGAHSLIRQNIKIPFAGNQYPGDFILGDVKIKWPWSYDSIHVFPSQHGVMVAFPMTQGFYRLILIPKGSTPSADADISIEEFRSIVQTLSRNRIEVLSSKWLTRFRTHHRIVKSYGRGRVFLAGDAAHIHSPAGGQGMNIGIQEAFNLSMKIKDVLNGAKPLSYLKNYERERRPIAKWVLWSTDLAFKFALIKENWLVRWARHHIVPHILNISFLQVFVLRAVSEVKMARREIGRHSV